MKNISGGVNRSHQKSLFEKILFSILHFLILLIGMWLIFFNGFGLDLVDKNRAILLFGVAVLYFIRHFITIFYLFVRKIEIPEVLGLSTFFFIFEIGFILIGGGIFRENIIPIGMLDYFALFLLLFGSFLNTFSEMQRKWWKQNTQNKGHCYTGGLFKYSMHINFFGDVVLFTGWAIFTYNILSFLLPFFILLGFIFFHIPLLDSYLLSRYGKEFENYSKRTKKLIPFIY